MNEDERYGGLRRGGRKLLTRNRDGEKLPLLFARQICVDIGLWEKLDNDDLEQGIKESEQLKNFQQMAITCNFKDSLIAFHGEDLDDDILDGLSIIHKATKAWLRGEVVGVLLNKISDKKITNRDFAASVAIIVDQLSDDEGVGGRHVGKSRTKELVVRMARMKDVQELADGVKEETDG